MVVNWIEWSDGGMSLHENIKGLAKETGRGWVRPISVLDDKVKWVYSSIDGKVTGSTDTRQQAMDALIHGLNATEIDGCNYSANPWHR